MRKKFWGIRFGAYIGRDAYDDETFWERIGNDISLGEIYAGGGGRVEGYSLVVMNVLAKLC